jgi:phage-related tail protein
LGDEPTQLHIIVDATKAHLHHAQEEKENTTVALKQEQEEIIEQCRVAQQEKDDLHTKFEEERVQINKTKNSFSQRSLESKKQSTKHFAL